MALTKTVVKNPAASAIRSVRIQIEGMEALVEALARAFEDAVSAIDKAKGRVIETGMGKSGLIVRKIAAALSSTGTPSLYIHPAEASHGNLGMMTSDDIVLALSWAGETTELSNIVTYCHRLGVMLAAITSRRDSTAGRADWRTAGMMRARSE